MYIYRKSTIEKLLFLFSRFNCIFYLSCLFFYFLICLMVSSGFLFIVSWFSCSAFFIFVLILVFVCSYFQLAASFESRIARVVLLVNLVYAALLACIFARAACIFSYQNLNLQSIASFSSLQDHSRAALLA